MPLDENSKNYWIDRFVESEEETFSAEMDKLPQDEQDELSNLLFSIFITEPEEKTTIVNNLN